MTTLTKTSATPSRPVAELLRAAIVLLALATAAIHLTLGGLLFTLNAVGYTTLAILMVAPGPIGRVRVFVRLALIGFTTATIGGWLLFGARFPLAFLDKALEVALVAAVAFEVWYLDGGPAGVVRRTRMLLTDLVAAAR
jgi:hypothetical protein